MRIYLDCLLGVKGEPWLICPRLSAVLPFTLHVSTRFLGGSASNCPADPLMPLLITSSSSSHAGLLRFLSNSRKYITFSVLWLKEHLCRIRSHYCFSQYFSNVLKHMETKFEVFLRETSLILLWTEQFLNEFVALLEATETRDRLEDVRIDRFHGRNNVRLHYIHHRQF